MPQKYGWQANLAVKAPFICIICDESAGFNWSDLHGEAMCNRCGTPYQLLHYDENKQRTAAPPRIRIKKDWIPVLRQYWQETQAYMGLGTVLSYRDYPECERGKKKFYDWIDKHPNLIPETKHK